MNALRRAQWLDRELGDPYDPREEFSYARRIEEDEAECYPSSALRRLLQVQLYHYYVPRALGGEFRSFEEVGALVRVVARRDLTIAITHAISLLGTAVIWLAGDASQQRVLTASVLEGEQVSVALIEPASSSDLLAMTTTARASRDGYHLTGEKWLGNGLNRHRFAVVYARTAERGGPRGFSLFLVDKEALRDGVRTSGKIPTLGLRGADLNVLRFDAQLPSNALVGTEGSGFEVILKALQISRTICGALSLGALDASLDTVLRLALQHKVDGQQVAELPQSQKLLVEAWAELLIGDSLTSLALRALHAAPSQASVHSAVAKYLVPTLAEQAMQKLSVVYGARTYLPHGDDPRIFQKMYRDNLAVSLFDGSTQVNLFNLSHQLRSLVIRYQDTEVPAWVHYASDPSEFDWAGLSLSASGHDAILAGFHAGICALRTWMQQHTSDDMRQALEPLLARLAQGKDELFDAVRRLSAGAAGDPETFELARRYCVVEAASAVLADWQLNRAALASTLAHPAVLAVVLHRLAAQLGEAPLLPIPCYRDCFAALLSRRERDGQCSLYVMPTEDTNLSLEAPR
jgi:alkylation response protein AidB-like acyl-CoA dehydrogenase